jgi:hypothetical protein
MLRGVTLVRTEVSEERITSIIKVTRISKLGTTLAVTNNRSSVLQLFVTANVVIGSPILVTLMMKAISFSETSVLFCGVGRGWVHLVRRLLLGLLYQPRMMVHD